MRVASTVALIIAAAAITMASPLRAAVPPLPDDLKPKMWRPPAELKAILADFEDVQDQEELAAHITKIEALLASHPDWVDLHRHYIGVTRLADRWSEVQARYQKMAEQDSTNADYAYMLGLFERGNAGARYNRRALALDPKSYYGRCGLALSLLQTPSAKPDSAFPLLFEAVRLRPDHPYGYQALALAYESVKDFETGIRVRQLQEIVEPESFQPVNYEARDLQQLGRTDEASQRIEGYVKKHPKDRNALRALVQSLNGSGRPADAARVQIDLADVAKDDPGEAYAAATLLGSNADTLRARAWLKKAAQRGFDDDRRAKEDASLAGVRADSSYFASIVEIMREQHQKKIPERKAKVVASLFDKPAPTFALKTMDGRDMKLDDLKGKVVVLDFWATWCGPCQLTLPLVRSVYDSVVGKPVEILCMNVWERDPDRARVAPYWKEKGYPMTVALAGADDAKNYGVTGIPTLFVIDKSGRLRYRHVGYVQFMDEDIRWVIESLLAEGP